MKTHAAFTSRALLAVASAAAALLMAGSALAQTGVDDDRVSLPEGPGSLEGLGDNVEIDPNMGAMSTNVQVQVPSGFGALTPNLSLSYSSSGGSGPVGIGWSMPEMSIERMTARRVPLYDTDDFFAANGSDELVRVETEGDGDLVYRSRFEKAFTRYTWVQPGSGADGYWMARFADGTVGYYGADRNGEIVDAARSTHPTDGTFRYMLVDHVDPYGHVLHYEYQSDFGDSLNNRPLLLGASWVDDGTGQALYSAEVTYGDRPDAISDAGAGFEELLTQRVTGITIRNGGETIREYALSYEDTSASGGFSRLAKVEQYGLGGRAGGELYPAVFEYEYQKGLGVQCDSSVDDCGETPYVFDMGNVAGGGQLTSGKATLIDINGDGLSDILDTSQGTHQFYLNTLTPDDSGFAHTFGAAIATGTNTSLVLTNASDTVQTLDFNGDGFSDLVDTISGTVLLNDPNSADWMPSTVTADVSSIQSLDFQQARFFDYDNDKKIDILLATTNNTQVFANLGTGFESVTTSALGVNLTDTGVQMADFNGDGLNDVVRVLNGGSISYRLNLGRGNWSPDWIPLNSLEITDTERALLDLEDLNGDGLSDLVLTGDGQIKYALNRNASRFDDWETVTTGMVAGTIPDRANKTVLYADMNANGSEDVVWFDTSGNVQYLELFPSRPNLLSRIDNNLGFIQKVTYGTAAEHAARAAADGTPWTTALPSATAVVDEVDVFVTLTGDEDGSGLHQVRTWSYRNGWYDGDEKQFRGFSDVTTELHAADGQEGGRTLDRYDLGDGGKPHRNGLLLSQIVESGGEVLAEKSITYDDCDLAQVPTPAELVMRGKKGVYHPCMTAEETVLRERLTSEADWVTLRTEMQYDGYGRVTLNSELGVVDETGDESYSRTSYYEPTADFWMLGLVAREESSASDAFAAADTTVTIHHYDGEDFVGLPEGQATHGFLTRTEVATAPGEFIEPLRQRRDEHGNAVETIDANGTLDGDDHRRSYAYDETGLFLTTTDLHLGDYALRRESRYERNFQKVTEATQWMLVEGDEVQTARNATTVRYDAFGRFLERFEPGDTDTPSLRTTWELGEPFSRVIVETRSRADATTFDERAVRCFDGRGQNYQSRISSEDGDYLVSGFQVFNANGQTIEVFEPFTEANDACSAARPEGVRSSTMTWDALGRPLETRLPGEDIYGETLVERTEYLPLMTEYHDAEDTADGAHHDTPTRTILDGLRRPVAYERELADGTVARTTLVYDATNSFAGYTDAEGNPHTLTVDLADRIVAVDDPNTGLTTFDYDAAGNVVSTTDARGVTVEAVYDGQNRLRERFDAADPEATRLRWSYDRLPDGDCELTDCTNLAGELVMVSYPVDLGGGRVEQGSDRFGYDQRRRLVFAARRFGLLADLVTRRSWDNQSRIVSTTHPDGTRIEIARDAIGRPVSWSGFVERLTYDGRGDWTALDYSNGARLERTLDALRRESDRRIVDAGGGVILSQTLSRGRTHMLTAVDAIDDVTGTADAMQVELDAWYRPTAITLGDETLSVGYDVLDRILELSSDAPDSPMDHGRVGYDPEQPLAAASAGELTMRYDAAGMMTARGEETYARDELGRLVGVTRDGASTAHMVYGESHRVLQRTEDGTLVLYGFDDFEVRDGIARVYARIEGQHVGRRESTSLAATIYPDATGDGVITAGDAFVAALQGDEAMPTTHVLAASAARLLVEAEVGATTALHTDHLGHVVAATDATGELRGRRGFYPWGLQRYGDGHVDVYGFTGQEHDVATGMIHMQHRELDPVTGRWDRFDPAFVRLDAAAITNSPGQASTGYAYVANMPLDQLDPTGLRFDNTKKRIGAFKARRALKKELKRQRKELKALRSRVRGERIEGRSLLESLKSDLNDVRAGLDHEILVQGHIHLEPSGAIQAPDPMSWFADPIANLDKIGHYQMNPDAFRQDRLRESRANERSLKQEKADLKGVIRKVQAQLDAADQALVELNQSISSLETRIDTL